MQISFLRYLFVIFAVATVSIFLDTDVSIAQSESATSDELQMEQAPPDGPPAPALNDSFASGEDLGYQALGQGPVHEAFAAPVDTDPTDGRRVYKKPPPDAIDERPPDLDSQGEEMKWISGYWSWSDEVDDYVWVSGIWRKLPRGRSWTPGYWSETESGNYRWTSGYWAGGETSTDTATYLPVPPKSIDNGPSTFPPSEEHFWVPGNWEYVADQYRWRSGFWSVSQGDWVWQPACYVDTPQGYLMVDGYWDYLPPNRGQLYAPIRFYDPVYLRPNYVYRPRYPLANAASLLLSLFVRPGYPHYYYGNFYGSSYASLGYRPWYDVGFGIGYSTPWLNNYDRFYRRSGIDFVGSMRRYEKHSDNDWKSRQPQHAGGKKSVVLDEHRISTAARGTGRADRSMDAFIRSDAGRVAMDSNVKRSNGNSGRNLAAPSLGAQSGNSRSRGFSSSQGIPSSFGSNGFSRATGPGKSDTRALGNSVSGGVSPGARAVESSRSFQRGPSSSPIIQSMGSPSAIQRGSSSSLNRNSGLGSSFQRGPSSSPSIRSMGSPSAIQRGSSSSLNRNRGSGSSFQRGGAPSFSGGLGSSGRGASNGKSGFKGGGSSARGKGKK